MKKGIHPQMQWASFVSQTGRLMPIMMTKISKVGKVYHLRAAQLKAAELGNIAKFRKRYGIQEEEPVVKKEETDDE